ncbi:MAG: hypothetical protein KJ578_12260 [Bacteroidetes bacterium]|nr:hypothetical protein [Bacteroidota bacterium]MBU1578233.1 hypothetical protein [Bacteroidota bacterium]MBU2558544.1 hypothetical protein [Bacteroidota bacterium]
MTLKNAINLFNRLVSETNNKSEIKVYQDFIKILTHLENKGLTQAEVQSIETELDNLALNSTNTIRIKQLKKSLQQFKKYLKDTFSLITKGHYTSLGITFGASAGLLFGVIFLSGLERSLGISLGISAGTLIGIIVAAYLESQAKTAGKLI